MSAESRAPSPSGRAPRFQRRDEESAGTVDVNGGHDAHVGAQQLNLGGVCGTPAESRTTPVIDAGVPLGLAAAARPGFVDELIMRGNDLVFAFPALLLAVLLTAVLGPGALNSIIAIGIFNIPVFARVTRGSALELWTRDFCAAARVAGKGSSGISFEHILPNLAGVLSTQVTIQCSLGVVAEAGLAYLGLGAQPPTPSWGRMLNEAQTLTALAPGLALYPGLAIALFVLGLQLLSAGIRPRRER